MSTNSPSLRGCAALGAAVVLALAGGCGSGGPELVPVTGTVTLDGTPVEGASVAFLPQSSGQPGLGTTDAEGKFTLKTHPHGPGAVAGLYTVTVRKMETTGVEADQDGLSGEVAPGGIQETWHTPKQYADAKTSGLTFEVKPGMEPVELVLKSP